MPTIYDIKSEYQDLLDELLDEECDTSNIMFRLEQLGEDANMKIHNIALVANEKEMLANLRKERGKEIIEKANKQIEQVKKMKEWLLGVMQQFGVEKVKGDILDVSIRKNPEKLVIIDEKKVPKEYIKSKTSEDIDKKSLKEAVKNGLKLDGIYLEGSFRVEIK